MLALRHAVWLGCLCACHAKQSPPTPDGGSEPKPAASGHTEPSAGGGLSDVVQSERISVAIGKGLVAADGTTRIEFVDVEEDNRCPVHAKCITAGWARIRVFVKRTPEPVAADTLFLPGSNLELPPDRVQLPGSKKSSVDLGDRVVYLIKLEPMPDNRKGQIEPPTKADYIATFLIELRRR